MDLAQVSHFRESVELRAAFRALVHEAIELCDDGERDDVQSFVQDTIAKQGFGTLPTAREALHAMTFDPFMKFQ